MVTLGSQPRSHLWGGFSPIISHTGGPEIDSTQDERSKLAKPWQTKAWIQVLAAVLGVLPPYSGLIILQLLSDKQLSMQAFILYLAVIAPLAIVIALLLLRFLCGEKLRDLNLRSGKLASDLLAVLVLSLVIIVTNVISTTFLSEVFAESPSNASVRNLFVKVAGDSKLFVLFIGLIFLGAASEEVIRVFLLSRVWKVWPSRAGKLLAVVISACVFGLIHLYQGPVHAAWAAIFGLIMALYYLRFGRIVPLILAHYLTNVLQIVVFAV
jgi:membrane protease YdiL (CAAX protease family)